MSLRAAVQSESPDGVVLRFEVEDTGPGIAQEVLPKLFSPFEQGPSSVARQHGGTGLGLAITRQLAELMGGSAGASSTAGQGSLFWFTAKATRCPLAVAPSGSESIDADTWAGECRDARILLVEDEPLNRTVTEAILKRLKARVDVATDGVEAIERCAQCDYDLILMDMQMPRMGGVEAAARLRLSPRMAHVPIVAFTANALADARAECLAAGMDDVLPKPVHPEVLADTVRVLLSRSSAARGTHARAIELSASGP